jgi:hypothetical protein
MRAPGLDEHRAAQRIVLDFAMNGPETNPQRLSRRHRHFDQRGEDRKVRIEEYNRRLKEAL